ncbi:hypothetical protein [Sinosporangium siamense]|uniref:Uncharacterized protein n=2 Tax=Sinosporangium siamense TaxID=1367973 RepID=A0A919RGF5_9ACTN|nr:hypothetical protein [Sinosporangium siamense]GII91481.1 hypothetical protein Ssi02_17120 [Sinosporangium siamense]
METSESSQLDPKTTEPPEVDETHMTSTAPPADTTGDRRSDTPEAPETGAVPDSAKDTVVFPKITSTPDRQAREPEPVVEPATDDTTDDAASDDQAWDDHAWDDQAWDDQAWDDASWEEPGAGRPSGERSAGGPPHAPAAEHAVASAESTAEDLSADLPGPDGPRGAFTPVRSPGPLQDSPRDAWARVRAPEAPPGTVPEISTETLAAVAAGRGDQPSAAEAPQSPAPPPPPPAKPRLLDRLLGSAPRWVPPMLTIEGLVMYILALRAAPGPLAGVDQADIDGLGLISALPVTAFAAIIVLIAAFFVTLAANIDRKGLLLFQLASVVFALHGASALIHDEPRFHTAWAHAGFVEYIARAGEALPSLDARFAWPGFFALFAFISRAAGITDLAPILQWTPLLSNLLYLLPFVMILRLLVATTRARWFAAMLFVLTQWIGQDYFSPQGFTFFLYLAFVAILLRWFGRASGGPTSPTGKGRIRALLAWLNRLTPGEIPQSSTSLGDRVIMLLVLISVFVAATASHQITPFMMLGALAGLLITRRTTLSWALPLMLGLLVLAWINYSATPYWAGSLDRIFGGLGRIFDNLQENTGDRLVGRDAQHTLVLRIRLGILGLILMLAATGLFRRIRRGVTDRAAVVMLCIPILALGLQSYGGEIGLRIYLFALPGVCILAAYAFFPNLPAGTPDSGDEAVPLRKRYTRFRLKPELTRRWSLVLAVCTALVLSMAFLVARYGNEKFERVSKDEVAAMHYVYTKNKPSARVLYMVPELGREITPTIPWRERDIETVNYLEALVTPDPKNLNPVISRLREEGPQTYLVYTNGQASYLELNHGFAPDWGQRFRAALDASTQLKKVFSAKDAAVYTLRAYPKGVLPAQADAFARSGFPTTTATPVGLVGLGTMAGGLFLYEVLRMRTRRRPSSGRAWALRVGLISAVIAAAVIVERFLVLGFGG